MNSVPGTTKRRRVLSASQDDCKLNCWSVAVVEMMRVKSNAAGGTSSSNAVLGLAMIVVGLLALVSRPVAVDAETVALSGPPERPSEFKNEGEVKEYLRALNDYFSIVGRPRFVLDTRTFRIIVVAKRLNRRLSPRQISTRSTIISQRILISACKIK